MSDNEDLLGDDLGDHSLADYNLGNEEEEQLLADDYDSGPSQNVPTSAYNEPVDLPTEYQRQNIVYNQPREPYSQLEPECVVPNITVEVRNIPPDHTFTPYTQPYEEHAVPPAIPAAPVESPQIVPSEMIVAVDAENNRELITGRNSQRCPLPRNIPDSLDKVFVPRASFNRGRNSWRNPQYRQNHPYRRNNYSFRGNFQRPSLPPPQIRPQIPNPQVQARMEIPEVRPDIPIRPDLSICPDLPIRTDLPIRPDLPIHPDLPRRPDLPIRPDLPRRLEMSPERSIMQSSFTRFERPMFFQRPYNPQFPEVAPPRQVIRQPLPVVPLPKGREQEVRMLPVLPPNLPPGGLAGKKVLINPHFKGNFQPPVEGLPTYIPTRIQKSPPLSPSLESKFGPIKDIDDAAERFIAEQRNALARAANRKIPRRSPQRYIENTTIEIENDLVRAPPPRYSEEDDLLRRQEEFINANRAGLRRRMRSPSPVRRSPSPRRSPERRPRLSDEESEYRRRVREQETLRDRVLRAKEVRRRKNAVALHKHLLDKQKEKTAQIQKEVKSPEQKENKPTSTSTNTVEVEQEKPDTTRKTPEREEIVAGVEKLDRVEKVERVENVEKVERDRSPMKVESAEANSTCENLTPPRDTLKISPERNLTPPLPAKLTDSDDDLDLILDDIDDILSDDDDTGRFKEKAKKVEEPPKKQLDLRSKLPPKPIEPKRPKQKIVFNEQTEEKEKKKKDKSPIRRTVLGSSKNIIGKPETKIAKVIPKIEVTTNTVKSRQKIVFDKKESEKQKQTAETKQLFTNRRVILQRKVPDKSVFTRIESADPSKPHPGIFSRAVRTAINEKTRIVIKNPAIVYESDSDDNILNEDVGFIAQVKNLPFGMTDTRLKTLAGQDLQSLLLDKEERTAKITFKTTTAAESFKRKFNNKMVAASRLTVTLI